MNPEGFMETMIGLHLLLSKPRGPNFNLEFPLRPSVLFVFHLLLVWRLLD